MSEETKKKKTKTKNTRGLSSLDCAHAVSNRRSSEDGWRNTKGDETKRPLTAAMAQSLRRAWLRATLMGGEACITGNVGLDVLTLIASPENKEKLESNMQTLGRLCRELIAVNNMLSPKNAIPTCYLSLQLILLRRRSGFRIKALSLWHNLLQWRLLLLCSSRRLGLLPGI